MTAHCLQTLLSAVYPVSFRTAERLLPFTDQLSCTKADLLEQEGQSTRYEFIVLTGIVRKYLTGERGQESTIGFFSAGQAITPILMRSFQYTSFVNLEVVSPSAQIVRFSHKGMEAHMNEASDLEAFGFQVIMQDSLQRAQRERVILSYSGKEKLRWFRSQFPQLENQIPHYYIASFLGLTSTSLSRLRKNIP